MHRLLRLHQESEPSTRLIDVISKLIQWATVNVLLSIHIIFHSNAFDQSKQPFKTIRKGKKTHASFVFGFSLNRILRRRVHWNASHLNPIDYFFLFFFFSQYIRSSFQHIRKKNEFDENVIAVTWKIKKKIKKNNNEINYGEKFSRKFIYLQEKMVI